MASNPTFATIQASAARYHELVRDIDALDYHFGTAEK
jgi:hypothetical protein